jgi:plastocyanin
MHHKMSQPKGSVGVALAITVIIIIAVTSVGYYQFVYCTSNSCSTSTSTSSAAGAGCTPPKCVTILMNFGAATLTTTAYTPDVARLVVGVNNTFQFINNDSQGGGIFHSATAKTCPQTCPFDTGVVAFNVTKGPFTITTPGTYPYFCVVHPTTMVGTIIVVAGSGSAASSSTSPASSTASSSTSQGPPPANGLAVSILKGSASNQSSLGYGPDTLTVVVGKNNTVVWTNNDAAAHTVTSTSVPTGATAFSSGIMSSNAVFWQTLTVPGTYQYICSLHSWMKGTIIVKSG